MKTLLTFGKGNAKLGKNVYTFSLPAGHTCPGASECLARADRTTGKVTDGPLNRFRCFAASQEATYRNVRESRWSNLEMLKGRTVDGMARLIADSLPTDATLVRVHVSGDFFSLAYLEAWLLVATMKPTVTFYAYTKSLNYWMAVKSVPDNFKLTASHGGKHDGLIESNGLKSAQVVFTEAEASDKGLPIDHDDSHAYGGDSSFALLIHGTQPKGSRAGKALQDLKRAGVKFSYSAKK